MPRGKGGGQTSSVAVRASTRTRVPTSKLTLSSTSTSDKKKTATEAITRDKESSTTPVNVQSKEMENKKKRGRPFQERLQWKMSNLSMPTTSTPVAKKPSDPREVTKKDVETAFGFDESVTSEEATNYSTLISPIAHSSPKSPLSSTAWKVNPLSQRNVECDPPRPSNRRVQVLRARKSNNKRPKVLSSTKEDNKKDDVVIVSDLNSVEFDQSSKNFERPTATATVISSGQSASSPATQVSPSQPEPVTKEVDKNDNSDSVMIVNDSNPTELQQSLKKVERPVAQSSSRQSKRLAKAGNNGDAASISDVSPKELNKPKTIRRAKTPAPSSSRSSRLLAKGTDKNNDAAVVEDLMPVPVERSSKNVKALRKRPSVQSRRVATTKAKKQISTKTRDPKVPPTLEHAETDDRPSPFSQLLDRYHSEDHEDDDDVNDVELHVDPKKIVRTYGSRKRVMFSEDRDTEYQFVPIRVDVPDSNTIEKESKEKRPKRKRKATKKEGNDELDEETRRWLEEKNKEFEDVQKVKLVIETSFSD